MQVGDLTQNSDRRCSSGGGIHPPSQGLKSRGSPLAEQGGSTYIPSSDGSSFEEELGAEVALKTGGKGGHMNFPRIVVATDFSEGTTPRVVCPRQVPRAFHC